MKLLLFVNKSHYAIIVFSNEQPIQDGETKRLNKSYLQ